MALTARVWSESSAKCAEKGAEQRRSKTHKSSTGIAGAKRDANPLFAVLRQLQLNCQDSKFTFTNRDRIRLKRDPNQTSYQIPPWSSNCTLETASWPLIPATCGH